MSQPSNDSLALATTSSEAIKACYQALKRVKKRVSLAYLCRRCAIPSTGYLSDVVHGKRTLNGKYVDAMADALELTGLRRKYFKLLVKRDNARDEEKRVELDKAIDRLRDALAIEIKPVDPGEIDWFGAFQVYAGLGLRPSGATLLELASFLGEMGKARIEEHLLELEERGLVRKEEGRFKWTKKHVVFEGPSAEAIHLKYFASALGHAMSSISRHYKDRERSLFMAQTVSVREEKYRRVLGRLREELLEAQAEIESAGADNLVYFNVQIYPHR